MKAKFIIEVVLVTFLIFLITILYSLIFKPMTNEIEKMFMRPFVYILLLGVPFIVGRAINNPIGTLGFKKENLLKQILNGIGIFIVLSFVFTIVILALGSYKGIFLPLKENSIGIIIYSIFFDMICAGLGEETLFRGYFIERFRTLTNSGTGAIVISALLFGFWHFPNGQDFLQVIFAVLIGAVYGFLRLKIKNCSTLSVGIAHGLHDVYLLILSCILL